MPRRSILSAAERERLLRLPDTKDELIRHYTLGERPLGWEHINLTGDYIWRQHKLVEQGKYRPLSIHRRYRYEQ